MGSSYKKFIKGSGANKLAGNKLFCRDATRAGTLLICRRAAELTAADEKLKLCEIKLPNCRNAARTMWRRQRRNHSPRWAISQLHYFDFDKYIFKDRQYMKCRTTIHESRIVFGIFQKNVLDFWKIYFREANNYENCCVSRLFCLRREITSTVCYYVKYKSVACRYYSSAGLLKVTVVWR